MNHGKYGTFEEKITVSDEWQKLKIPHDIMLFTSLFIVTFVPEILKYSAFSFALFLLMNEFEEKKNLNS